MLKKILIAAAVLLVAVQLIPVGRTNPPATSKVDAPQEALAVLERSCFDCHSNESRWPWYAYVAPVSWLVTHDVKEGREHVNFSEWAQYDAEKVADILKDVHDEVEEGNMPLPIYLFMHRDARLSDQDRQTLYAWAEGRSTPAGN
jgi:mono/diheme cytochrome c family protein